MRTKEPATLRLTEYGADPAELGVQTRIPNAATGIAHTVTTGRDIAGALSPAVQRPSTLSRYGPPSAGVDE